jgi:Kef-type K+ transport system membrane component KefB
MSTMDLALRFFLQLTVILGSCRLIGWLGQRILGQTQVVMEMIVGVMLGPSLFGLLAPEWQQRLFPTTLTLEAGGQTVSVIHPSMAILFALSQLGLVLYMFVVGLELETDHLRASLGRASLISTVGVAAPFILGALLGLQLVQRDGLFLPEVDAATAALYLGAAMAITAFPMLARILYERGLAGSRLGTLTLAAGSIDDAIAWCLLAVVVATLGASPIIAFLAIGGGALYCVGMMTAGRRLLAPLGRRLTADGKLDPGVFILVILTLMLCAFVTDWLGIYAVFGAFVCGVAMPRGAFSQAIIRRIEPLTVTVLLPIFFVYSGLATRFGLLDSKAAWLLTAVVIVFAMAGKGLACTLAARWSGESWRDSATIGTLMNARGLMELIILNVGLERGVIGPRLFAVMALMAIVTTVMTSPIYNWLTRNAPAERYP